MAASISPRCDTSAFSATAPSPIARSAALNDSGSRPVTTTEAPSRAKAFATARPIPLLPPVTTATFPTKRFERASGPAATPARAAASPGREEPINASLISRMVILLAIMVSGLLVHVLGGGGRVGHGDEHRLSELE